jgi:hypothetical protein
MSPYPRVTYRCEEFVQPVLPTSDALRPKAQAEFHTREVPGSIPGAPILARMDRRIWLIHGFMHARCARNAQLVQTPVQTSRHSERSCVLLLG